MGAEAEAREHQERLHQLLVGPAQARAREARSQRGQRQTGGPRHMQAVADGTYARQPAHARVHVHPDRRQQAERAHPVGLQRGGRGHGATHGMADHHDVPQVERFDHARQQGAPRVDVATAHRRGAPEAGQVDAQHARPARERRRQPAEVPHGARQAVHQHQRTADPFVGEADRTGIDRHLTRFRIRRPLGPHR